MATAFADGEGAVNPPLAISDEGTSQGLPVFTLDCVGAGIACTHSGTTGTITVSGSGGGAPTDAEYLVSTADGTLSAEDVVTEGLAIDYSNGAGTGTFAFDPTELTGNRTWADGTDASLAWTYNLTSGDPVLGFQTNALVTVTGTARISQQLELGGVLSCSGASSLHTTAIGRVLCERTNVTWDAILSPIANQSLNMAGFDSTWSNVDSFNWTGFDGLTITGVVPSIDQGTGAGGIKLDGSLGGCLMVRDTDDAGWTECCALNGTLTCGIDADGTIDGTP